MKKIIVKNIRNALITSESVAKGHPDKICDQIADSILDHVLEINPSSRVACEVLASNRLILIGGEITTSGYVDVIQAAWHVIKPLGYSENDFTIISNINSQSKEIANSINYSDGQLGAGDQGITIGYAVAETDELMPLGVKLANQLLIKAEQLRVDKIFPELMSDMKSQVSLLYEENEVSLKELIISAQHISNIDLNIFREKIKKLIVFPVLQKMGFIVNENEINNICLINNSKSFHIGGPIGDTGLTGRKLMVDSYGNYAHHGGGSYSGKDYTKVDRTGAYYARWIAKHIVALNWATECEVKIAWAIGEIKPLSIYVDCFNTNNIPIKKIQNIINNVFNYSLREIVDYFDLKKIKYLPLATFGHFGRSYGKWEELTFLDKLKSVYNSLN